MIKCEIYGIFSDGIFEIDNQVCFDFKNKINKEEIGKTTNNCRKFILNFAIKDFHAQIKSSKVNVKHIIFIKRDFNKAIIKKKISRDITLSVMGLLVG